MIGFREKLKAMEILESTIWFPSSVKEKKMKFGKHSML
ncbi:hypothetical protein NC652_012450 [Populus alba x Populus x berolinensis]|nr:hypothetical protein NC652_012450 [Populus alba x Populus x berolinensis]